MPLGLPPKIPEERPPTTQEKNIVLKQVARWLKEAIRVSAPIRAFLIAYEAASWLDTDRPISDSYLDPPRTMEELQDRALTRRAGYDIHHVVEKDSAEEDGFPQSKIQARDNWVLVPRIKHWEITGWYMRPNKDYGDLSPRDYLRGRSWEERGHRALIVHGVLRP